MGPASAAIISSNPLRVKQSPPQAHMPAAGFRFHHFVCTSIRCSVTAVYSFCVMSPRIWRLTVTTASTVKPNFSASTLAGADAPNRSMLMILP